MKKILMRKGLLGLLIVALLVILGAGLSYSAREAAAPLVKNQNSTVFFIVGEMHLGKSQKDVAKVVVDLINVSVKKTPSLSGGSRCHNEPKQGGS